MKKIVTLILALMLLLSLTACSSAPAVDAPAAADPQSSEAPAAQAPAPSDAGSAAQTQAPIQAEPTPEPIPEAVLDPEEIEWGYQSYDPAETQYGDDAQYWYVNGEKNTTNFIFFEDGYLTTVDGENRNMVDTETVDMHIVDYETKGSAFDFVFTDVLTCYDLVSNTWYKRGDYESIVASLTGATYVCEVGSQWTYTFNADGTFVHDDDGDMKPGTWWISDALTIKKHFDDEPADRGAWFNITYEDASWDIKSIKDVDVYYPES